MRDTQKNFHGNRARRQILVVDDELINREILSNILWQDYEVLTAENGREALEIIREKQKTLSLVLLDLLMPEVGGFEVMAQMKADQDLRGIPIIVMTSEQSAEVESLKAGAIDFITKPYNHPEIILARVLRTIELMEDREILSVTERDSLTGLYNREFFFRYAEQFDQYHPDLPTDAILLDINHFHTINERYGKAAGDTILVGTAERVRAAVSESGGIVCRLENDTFLIYCPHRDDYAELLENARVELPGEGSTRRVRLRMGIYQSADHALDMERRFDRARQAANTVRSSYNRAVAVYDEKLKEEELYAEQLIEDFHEAIVSRQFCVYYQPKFNIRGSVPVLASAEALIRWKHPKLGMISPGRFIPLFEKNGLIRQLDRFVWEEAAAQIRAWRDTCGITVPVSVNVSRVDLYDPDLLDTFTGLLETYGITGREYLLEVTESVYTADSAIIIENVRRLRDHGFRIEMDDFGSGYSSLGMITNLPIDALKVDMMFVRNAFNDSKNIRMLELIIDIAEYLRVPVIAEGVETADQLRILKEMGCDIIQGYYFSKPVPPEEFLHFLTEKRAAEERNREMAPEKGGEGSALALASYPAGKVLGADMGTAVFRIDPAEGAYDGFFFAGRERVLEERFSGTSFAEEALPFLERQCTGTEALVPLFADMEHTAEALGRTGRTETFLLQAGSGGMISREIRAVLSAGMAGDARAPLILLLDGTADEDCGKELQSAFSESELPEGFLWLGRTGSRGFWERAGRKGLSFFAGAEHAVSSLAEGLKAMAVDASDLSVLNDRELPLLLSVLGRFALDVPLFSGRGTYPCRLTCEACGAEILFGLKETEGKAAAPAAPSQIAQALAEEDFLVFLIDPESGNYGAYSQDKSLVLTETGTDFFAWEQERLRASVHPEDLEKALSALDQGRLSEAVSGGRTYRVTFRQIHGGKERHVRMKALHYPPDPSLLLIGMADVSAQMEQEQAYRAARESAMKDPLTGIKNRKAYEQAEAKIDVDIMGDASLPFAVVLFDVDGLRFVNDTKGHRAGDLLIKEACMEICNIYKHSPVYRLEGDEFASILRGHDYEHRLELMEELEKLNRCHEKDGGVVITGGVGVFAPGKDGHMAQVCERAGEDLRRNKARNRRETKGRKA